MFIRGPSFSQTICNATCQSEVPILTVDALTGLIRVTDPVTGSDVTIPPNSIPGLQGSVTCASVGGNASSTSCKLLSMSLSAQGFSGTYGLSSGLASLLSVSTGNFTGGRRLAAPTPLSLLRSSSLTRTSRLLATSTSNSSSLSVSSPVVCLELGQGMLFDLPAGKTSYPVYVKDSFLNTNPAFDYGAFRTLAALAVSQSASVSLGWHVRVLRIACRIMWSICLVLCQQRLIRVSLFSSPGLFCSNTIRNDFLSLLCVVRHFRVSVLFVGFGVARLQVTAFAFTFPAPGIYVFAASDNPSAQTIIAVQSAGKSCAGMGGQILPMSASAFVGLGIVKARPASLVPDWALLGAIVGGLMGVVFGLLGCAVWFRARGMAAKGTVHPADSECRLSFAMLGNIQHGCWESLFSYFECIFPSLLKGMTSYVSLPRPQSGYAVYL